jgi:DNA-binding beta-propeller fold protein YncE
MRWPAASRDLPTLRRPSHIGRKLVFFVLSALALGSTVGCDEETPSIGHLEKVWGRRGISDGRLQKPRAMAIDAQDQLYIVDMTARIQVFTTDGEFLRGWQTPVHENGRPTGLSIDHAGRVLVADTHYFRVLTYSPEGKLLQQLGGLEGHSPGTFGFVTDAIEDRQGNLYVSEYGEYDRIQKFAPDGKFLLEWGGHGSKPGQFIRPQNMAIDEQDRIWVCDACNHRIQIFDVDGKLLESWGQQGSQPGQLYYPYDLVLDDQGQVYVCEYGNHRVQKFTRAGVSLGCWGREGRGPGELHNPWALVRDSQGRIHVLDTNNHRVQRIVM